MCNSFNPPKQKDSSIHSRFNPPAGGFCEGGIKSCVWGYSFRRSQGNQKSSPKTLKAGFRIYDIMEKDVGFSTIQLTDKIIENL